MFKIGSFEEEIASGMEKKLISNQLENKYSFEKVAKAADFIHAAAELLDDTGFHIEAKDLTDILEKLAFKDKEKLDKLSAKKEIEVFENEKDNEYIKFKSLADLNKKYKK